MVLPGLLLLIIFRYLPIPNIVVAFKDYNIFDGVLKAVGWIQTFSDAICHAQILFCSQKYVYHQRIENRFWLSGAHYPGACDQRSQSCDV